MNNLQQASKILITSSNNRPAAGTTVIITAQLADEYENAIAIAGIKIDWEKSNSFGKFSSVSSVTNSSGIATVEFTVHNLAGTHTSITASHADVLKSTSDPITTKNGPATKYLIIPDKIRPAAGSNVTLRAQLADANNNPVATSAITVFWSKSDVNGSFSAPSSMTDSSGSALITFKAHTLANTMSVISVEDENNLKGTSDPLITNVGTAHNYLVTSSNYDPAAGSEVTLTAQLVDEHGNPLPEPGRVISWLKNIGEGSFASGTSETDSTGLATIVFNVPTTAESECRISVVDDRGLKGICNPFTIVNSAPTKYLLSCNNLSPAAGSDITISAQLVDSFNNPVAAPGIVVNWSKANGTFSTPSSVTDNNGVATVVFKTHTVAGTGGTVTATDENNLSGTTANITTVSGKAALYLVSCSNSSPAAGNQVTVIAQLADKYNNPVPVSGVTVNWNISSGSLAESSSETNGNGIASIVFTSHTVAGSTTTVTASDSNGLTGVSSPIITTFGKATKYLVTSSNNNPEAGSQVIVTAQLADAHNNPVNIPGLLITWSKNNINGTFASPTSHTNANGMASILFTSHIVKGTSTTIMASDNNNISGISRAPIVTGSGTPTKYLVSANNSRPVAGSQVLITAQLADIYDNPVANAGLIVNWSKSNPGGVFTSATSLTNENGLASILLTTHTQAQSSGIVTATDNNFLSGNSSMINTVSGVPSKYLVTANNKTPAAGTAITITAQLADSNNNPVEISGLTVSWSKSDPNGSFASLTSQTNANGIAKMLFTTHSLAGTSCVISARDTNNLIGSSNNIITNTGIPAKYVIKASTNKPLINSAVVLSAQLSDSNNNPVAVSGLSLIWSKDDENATFSTDVSQTNENGSASTILTVQAEPDLQTTVKVKDTNGLSGTSETLVTTTELPLEEEPEPAPEVTPGQNDFIENTEDQRETDNLLAEIQDIPGIETKGSVMESISRTYRAMVGRKASSNPGNSANDEITPAGPAASEAEASDDLHNIEIIGLATEFAFDPGNYQYNGLTVSNTQQEVSITPWGDGLITVDGNVVDSGTPSSSIALVPGEERHIIVLVSQPGKTPKSYSLGITRELKGTNSIRDFKISGNGQVNDEEGTISVTVPHGTDVTSLTPEFEIDGEDITVNGISQESGSSSNDFSSPVNYKVIAENGSVREYTVTVEVAASSSKSITSFTILGDGTVNEEEKTIEVTVPSGTDISSAVADFQITGVRVEANGQEQSSGITANNFNGPVTYSVFAEDGTKEDYAVTVHVLKSSSNTLDSFKILDNGVIDEDSGSVDVIVPFGTDITRLVPVFHASGTEVTVDGETQVSGVTEVNFQHPVTYTITAEDGSIRSYTINVRAAANTAKELSEFKILGEGSSIDQDTGLISVSLPAGTEITSLRPEFETTGVSVEVGGIKQESGVTELNFTEPVRYTVKADDGSNKDYLVNVTVEKRTTKELTSFSIEGNGRIDEHNGSIIVTLPYGTDASSLTADFTTNGETVKVVGMPQESGITTNNFNNPLTYTVTAEDGSSRDYIVTVTVAPSPNKDFISFRLIENGIINQAEQTIQISLPAGTDVSALVPYFTTNGSSVKVGGVNQISGVSTINFSKPVIYTITAEDGSSKNYTVKVDVEPVQEQLPAIIEPVRKQGASEKLSSVSEPRTHSLMRSSAPLKMLFRRGQNNKNQGNLEFLNLGAIMKKYLYHWPLFLLSLLLAAGCAYAYLSIVNPVYEVSATILVKDEKKAPQENNSAVPELEQGGSTNAETEIEIIRSKQVLAPVIDKLQLWTTYKTKEGLKTIDLYTNTPVKFFLISNRASANADKEVNVKILDPDSFETKDINGDERRYKFGSTVRSPFGTWTIKPQTNIGDYIGSTVSISVADKEDVINDYVDALDAHLLDKLAPTIGLFVNDEVPQRGKDFLNNVILSYNGAALDEQKRVTKSTIEFIDKRLASLTGELNAAERQVEGYRSSQGLTDIDSQAKVYLENVQATDGKLNEINVQLNIIDGIESYVNSSNTNADVPATIGITDPSLNNLISKLSELQLKKSALLANTPEQNPMFSPLNEQIAQTKASIRNTVSGIKNSLNNSKRGLQSFNNKYESSIRDIPVQERKYVGMQRQQSIKENLYVYLLQKREELALSYASTTVDARIVDQASVGSIQWPKVSLIYAIALLLGLGLPFLSIYFRDSLHNVITKRSDIESAVEVPILEELSYEDMEQNTLVANLQRHIVGEQFRSLRTNLNFLHQNVNHNIDEFDPQEMLISTYGSPGSLLADTKGRVTLLTSSISKEGKSFVSTNLAASLASTGRKTVILEMDLRKPRVSVVFDLSKDHPGITDFLGSSDLSVEEVIQSSGKVPNLDVIGAGGLATEPTTLLENYRLNDLIETLKEQYDDIIIDSPPVHLVTDAMIIAKHADVTLYVIRQGYTSKDELPFLREIHDTGKLPNLNIIFNGIKKFKYGYGYNYDNSYYNSGPSKTTFRKVWKSLLSRF